MSASAMNSFVYHPNFTYLMKQNVLKELFLFLLAIKYPFHVDPVTFLSELVHDMVKIKKSSPIPWHLYSSSALWMQYMLKSVSMLF